MPASRHPLLGTSYSSTFVKEKQRIGQGSRPSSLRSITKKSLDHLTFPRGLLQCGPRMVQSDGGRSGCHVSWRP